MTVANKRNSGRSYSSPIREQQARRTAVLVIEAAGQCFAEQGYGRTTMKDVAERAGVSVETVYGQGSKASLLLAGVDRVLAGDADSTQVSDRTDMRAVLGAADPREALRQLRALVIASLPSALPVLSAFQHAAHSDPDIGTAYEAYERRRWNDLRPIADTLASGLRPGVTVDQAADVIWSLLDPTAADGLISRRGWTIERWATWVTTALEQNLLREDTDDPA